MICLHPPSYLAGALTAEHVLIEVNGGLAVLPAAGFAQQDDSRFFINRSMGPAF